MNNRGAIGRCATKLRSGGQTKIESTVRFLGIEIDDSGGG
jgi:hypothetical protein